MSVCIFSRYANFLLRTLQRRVWILVKDEVGLEAAKVFTVRSTLDRFDDMYRLEMTMHVEGQKSTSYAQLEKSISSWFDTNGVLRKDLLRKDVDKLHRSLLDGRKASIIN